MQPTWTLKGSVGAPQSATAPADNLIVDTTTQTFARDVLEASRQAPVLVDFWADWCGPCRQLTPVLEKAVRAAKGKVKLVKLNIDKHPEIPGQLGIQSIPAVIAFRNGRPLDGFMGALPESQVKAFIERLSGPAGPSDVDTVLDEAESRLAAGEPQEAAELFAAALDLDLESPRAYAGLIRAQVALGDLDGARRTLAQAPKAISGDPAIAAARAAIEVAEQAAKLGDPAKLKARIEANPNDHQARFDLALIHNARGDREAAVEALVNIVRRDRSWNDDAARKQLLQFFEAWGPKDPATAAGRRRLSAAIFS